MAKEFSLVTDPNATVFKVFTIASQAYQVGDAVMLSTTAATVIPATSSTTTSKLIGVAMEARASTDTQMLVALITDQQSWAADSANAGVTTDNLQRMVLTDKGTVNNTHTDSTASGAIFRQEGILTGSRIVGRFINAASA